MIMGKLKQLNDQGVMAREQQTMQDYVKNILLNPPPVPGLKRTDTPRTFYYDPSMILQEDLRTSEGKMIYKAGTRLNPADFIPFKKTIVFLDADDSDQVAWFKAWSANNTKPRLIVLVGGPIFTIMNDWQQRVYFDQEGRITQRLGIQQVPAIVKQHENRLQIDEVLP